MPAERFIGASWNGLETDIGRATRGTVGYLGWVALIWFYRLEQSAVVTIGPRSWGEDFLVRRDHERTSVLINRYTVHGHHVIVVVDEFRTTPGEKTARHHREDLVAPIMQSLEFQADALSEYPSTVAPTSPA